MQRVAKPGEATLARHSLAQSLSELQGRWPRVCWLSGDSSANTTSGGGGASSPAAASKDSKLIGASPANTVSSSDGALSVIAASGRLVEESAGAAASPTISPCSESSKHRNSALANGRVRKASLRMPPCETRRIVLTRRATASSASHRRSTAARASASAWQLSYPMSLPWCHHLPSSAPPAAQRLPMLPQYWLTGVKSSCGCRSTGNMSRSPSGVEP
mmetsp:Transcript_7211/g.22921  ORF Transcript_7211/g.22921 Transcript_7211/m.22921 type:complete len:217 (+) Transcript_7211:35-685(+)